MTTTPVLAVARYRDNGELVSAAHRLAHLRDDWSVLDCTYGAGTFWKNYRPPMLVACDLYPTSPLVRKADFTAIPFPEGSFDVAVLDGPYGLRGTVNGERWGNGGYGLDSGYVSVEARHDLIRAGISECARVARCRVLVKCQAQVCQGRVYWQDRLFADHAEEKCGLRLVERLDMLGGDRPQPARFRWRCLACERDNVGPRHECAKARALWPQPRTTAPEARPWLERHGSPQVHAYGRPSTLLIFAKRGA